jgi:molybdenum cofactor cytidylyltransferase
MTSAILLAAGESTRMGRPKALLPWGNETLIEYQVGELRAAGIEDIVVVLGHDADVIQHHVAGARTIVNDSYREGRASSLRAGASAIKDGADAVLVLSVDQPRPRKVHERLLTAHAGGGALVTVPACDGRRGHPVVVAETLLPELRAGTEAERGMHGVIERHEVEVRELAFILLQHESMANEPDLTALMVLLDINTPEDYENALAIFGKGTRPPTR